MLSRVHIQGFKSLLDVELELGRFNVFVGSNGSGKTNLLEAIGVAGCAASGRVDDGAFLWRGVRPGLPALFKAAMRGRRIRRLISLGVESGTAEYRVALDNPIRDPAKAWRIANEAFDEDGDWVASRSPAGGWMVVDDEAQHLADLDPREGLGPAVRIHHPRRRITRLVGALTDFAIYTPFTPMLRGTTQDPSQRDPLGLAGGGLADALRDVLRHRSDVVRRLREVVYPLVDWAKAMRVGTAAAAQLSPAISTTRDVLRVPGPPHA